MANSQNREKIMPRGRDTRLVRSAAVPGAPLVLCSVQSTSDKYAQGPVLGATPAKNGPGEMRMGVVVEIPDVVFEDQQL